jgi:toxin ParE1/3/4
MPYRLSTLAEQDLEEIWSYVADDASVTRADRLIDAILDRFELLAEQPGMGRNRPEFGGRHSLVRRRKLRHLLSPRRKHLDRESAPRSPRSSRCMVRLIDGPAVGPITSCTQTGADASSARRTQLTLAAAVTWFPAACGIAGADASALCTIPGRDDEIELAHRAVYCPT